MKYKKKKHTSNKGLLAGMVLYRVHGMAWVEGVVVYVIYKVTSTKNIINVSFEPCLNNYPSLYQLPLFSMANKRKRVQSN